ncbi:MAG: leucine-rich repeat domain-containing protein [Lentisphaeraceae bacterium]|nr:leucine-rich repeat domain-containing protein [Lentisphaeraceae bacterium]
MGKPLNIKTLPYLLTITLMTFFGYLYVSNETVQIEEHIVAEYRSLIPIIDVETAKKISLAKLESLSFTESNQEEIHKYLLLYPKIKKLSLMIDNELDLSSVENLNSLEELYIRFSSIKNLNSLSNLKNLKTLHIVGCFIQDISFLKNLDNLEEINLEGNEILDFNVLKSLSNLKIVYVSEKDKSKIDLKPKVEVLTN